MKVVETHSISAEFNAFAEVDVSTLADLYLATSRGSVKYHKLTITGGSLDELRSTIDQLENELNSMRDAIDAKEEAKL